MYRWIVAPKKIQHHCLSSYCSFHMILFKTSVLAFPYYFTRKRLPRCQRQRLDSSQLLGHNWYRCRHRTTLVFFSRHCFVSVGPVTIRHVSHSFSFISVLPCVNTTCFSWEYVYYSFYVTHRKRSTCTVPQTFLSFYGTCSFLPNSRSCSIPPLLTLHVYSFCFLLFIHSFSEVIKQRLHFLN